VRRETTRMRTLKARLVISIVLIAALLALGRFEPATVARPAAHLHAGR